MLNDFKRTERMLYSYSHMKTRVRCLRTEIDELEEEMAYISAVDTSRDAIKSGEVSSPVESLVARKLDAIRKRQLAISRLQSDIDRLDEAVASLSTADAQVARLRYFEREPWFRVAQKVGYSSSHVRSKCRARIIGTLTYILNGTEEYI